MQDIEERARSFAHTYLLMMLVEIQKQKTPDLGKQLIASFDAFLGEHMDSWGTDSSEVLSESRRLFQNIVDNYLPTLKLEDEPKTLRRKFLRWLQQN